jgi:hypothetical protein
MSKGAWPHDLIASAQGASLRQLAHSETAEFAFGECTVPARSARESI